MYKRPAAASYLSTLATIGPCVPIVSSLTNLPVPAAANVQGSPGAGVQVPPASALTPDETDKVN